jgi:hypothetical protein
VGGSYCSGFGGFGYGLQDCEGGGETEDEQGSAFGFVLAGDLAGVVLDDAPGDAQAEAGALADGFGGVEGIEYTI